MLSALIYEKTNEFSKAQAAYEKILSGTPDFAPALNNLAYLNAERLKNLDKALELAKRARALQPSDAAIADTLGWILYKQADYQQALILLRESAQNLPDNPESDSVYVAGVEVLKSFPLEVFGIELVTTIRNGSQPSR